MNKKLKIMLIVYSAMFLISFLILGFLKGFPYVFKLYHIDGFWFITSCVIAILVIVGSHILMMKTTYFDFLIGLFKEFFEGYGIFTFLLLALLSGFAEELLFRGLLQDYMGLILTSLIFGILHIGPSKNFLPWTGFAIIMGFVLGITRELSVSILVPSIIHVFVNFVNMLALKYWVKKEL
ncbi:MAG: CPBP family intramembrane glutamic endopeptidase [Pseudomonadota bacterium]